MSSVLAVWLIVLGFDDQGRAREKIAMPMPSIEVCNQSVAAAKTDGARSGDAQTVVVVFCATGDPKDRSSCYPATKDFNGETWPCEIKELHK